jgi:superfamily I DNA/RNA helicase
MPWNDDLNPMSPAYGIAADTSRFVRVVAGPGTGKSFALKRRVARLLESQVPPSQILPVTFTNVAAEDLQRELTQIIKGLPPSAPDDEPTPEEQVAHLEEQRRLFYVGLTRVKADPAKNWPGTLLLTSSWTMTSRAAKQSKLPDGSFGVANGRATVQTSQFIRELGPAAPASRPG